MKRHIIRKLILHVKGWEPELWNSNILVWDINGERPAIFGKIPKLIRLPTEAWTNAVRMSQKPLRTINSPQHKPQHSSSEWGKERHLHLPGKRTSPLAATWAGARLLCYQSQQEFCHSFPQRSPGFYLIFLATDFWKKYSNLNLFYPEFYVFD